MYDSTSLRPRVRLKMSLVLGPLGTECVDDKGGMKREVVRDIPRFGNIVGAEVGKVGSHPRITSRDYRVDIMLVGALPAKGTNKEGLFPRFKREVNKARWRGRVYFATARSSAKDRSLNQGSFFFLSRKGHQFRDLTILLWEKECEMRVPDF